MPSPDEMRATADRLVSSALQVAESHRALITHVEQLEDQLKSTQTELQLAIDERTRALAQVASAEHDRDNAKMAAALLQEQLFDVEDRLTAAERNAKEMEDAMKELKPS